MRSSPIQLIETAFELVTIKPNKNYDSEKESDFLFENVALQFRTECKRIEGYWEGEKRTVPGEMDKNTFRVLLGVRTPPESNDGPYIFEVVCSGIVGCGREKVSETLPSAVAAEEYGYAMLYGMVREQILTLTSRMKYGSRMMPTMTFMGHVKDKEQRKLKRATEAQLTRPEKIAAGGSGESQENDS